MTEENNIEIEIEEESQEEAPQEENDYDPNERVEITDPKVQRKFNDIYKQMKMSDSRNKMHLELLQKQDAIITDLQNRFKQSDHMEAEKVLTARLKAARDAEDEELEMRVLNELIEYKADQKVKGLKAEPKQTQESVVSQDDFQYVSNWAQETNDDGSPKRPWMMDNHPRHQEATNIAKKIGETVLEEFGYFDIEEVMDRVEVAMQKKQVNKRAPDPMRANLTKQPARSKIKLSSAELEIAAKLGVKPEEYAKWK